MPKADAAWLLRKAKQQVSKGDLTEAELIGRNLLAEDPGHLGAGLLLASILARTGRASQSVAVLNNAALCNPKSAAAHAAISNILFDRAEYGGAMEHGVHAIWLTPEDPEIAASFICRLDQARKEREAEQVTAATIDRRAEDAEYLHRFGELLSTYGRNRDAIKALQHAAQASPGNCDTWLLLGRLLTSKGDVAGALRCGLEAVKLEPNSVAAHVLLASAYSDAGDEACASHHYEAALALDPKNSDAICGLGIVLQHQGDFERANGLLTQAITLRKTNGYAQYALIQAQKQPATDEAAVRRLEKLAQDPLASQADQIFLTFAAAKGWEQLGQFEKAIRAYDAANEKGHAIWLGEKGWDRIGGAEKYANIVETFNAKTVSSLAAKGNRSKVPILIVGMPRSGTTLVEQIISSHEDVHGAGELTFWQQNVPPLIWGEEPSPDPNRLAEVAENYLTALNASRPSAGRVTDKMPMNYAYLGIVAAAFPNARFIHVSRDPLDTCLSIYTTVFGRPLPFAFRREDIAFEYREYLQLMTHWRCVLDKTQLLDVAYEDLVSNRESVTRKIIDFLNLPWDENCLSPEKNARLVQTASLWQVRQPVYASSVGRAQSFKPWIPEFFELDSSDQVEARKATNFPVL